MKSAQVRSVAKAMELLEALLERRAPMSLRELASAVGYPKSTVHTLLSTLRAHAMVEQRPDGRYALGLRLFECGCAVSAGWDVPRLARPYLEKLSALTDASAFLSLLEDDHVISVDRCAGVSGVQVVPEAGCRLPLHATSQGKVLLAQLAERDAAKRLERAGMPPYTPHTITDAGAFLGLLAEVRRNGCAVEDGEYKIGLRSVSAPVYDSGGSARYALGVVGLFRRVRSEEFQNAAAQTKAQAEALSRALGWQGPAERRTL